MRIKILTLALLIVSTACAQPLKVESVKLFSTLPDYCNTPDAMFYSPKDNAILLSVPNFNDTKYPGVIMKVDFDGTSKPYYPCVVHPETGKAGPMGLEFGLDGNIYYADNQYFFDKDYKSSIVRIVIENGVPVRSEVVVENIKLANAVRWNGDYLYVSDTFFDLGDPKKVGYGGIYRISMEEMNKGVVKLIADKNVDDPHLVAKSTTTPHHRGDNAGFDGMCFDSNGNLYSGTFGDGKFYKISFDTPNGKVKECRMLTDKITCVDGICFDPQRNYIYITDSEKNAVHVWDVANEKLFKLWENGDTDGSDGLLDQPCEPLIMGNKIYVANFDSPFPGLKNSAYDGIHTLSVINIKE